MPAAEDGALYDGRVMHARLGAVRHRFVYRVFSLLADLDALPALDARLRLFAYNRAGAVSFHDRDHGARDGGPLRPWVDALLRRAGLPTGGRIRILCFPRVLGYVFNPISVYFCDSPEGALQAVVYEVKNTFGDQHPYLMPVSPADAGKATLTHACDKALHVSPFMPMAQHYRFRLAPPADRYALAIFHGDGRLDAPGGPALVATHVARRRPLTDAALARRLAAVPPMTVKVTAGIHWEALRLWSKGARFHRRPDPAPDAAAEPAAPW